jgi:paired amphipathic helix protein Sin3a
MDDRKKLPVRALAKEIEELHADDPSTPQFQFEFKDKTLLKDVTRILFSYLERRGGYRGGHKDDELIKAFIEMFLPVLFDVPDVLPTEDKELEDEEEVEEDETQSQHSYDSELSSGTRRGRSSPRHRLMNDDEKPLLKDVLTRSIKNTVAASSDEDEEEIPEEEEPKEPKEPKEQKFHRFFGNTAFYCFFRLLQIAYERLGAVKLLDQHHEKGLNVTTKTMYCK